MIRRELWIQHVFPSGISPGWVYNIIERLEGTLPRLEYLCSNIDPQLASCQWNDQWSIKDHIGHLNDLEALHTGRLEDFISKSSTLRSADMQNVRTSQAWHSDQAMDYLIVQFEASRRNFIERLKNLDDEIMLFESLHPRLNILMKPVDLAFFVAEHDDHHLTTIRAIIQNQS